MTTKILAGLAGAILLIGCTEPLTEPDIDQVAGVYHASGSTGMIEAVEAGGRPIDMLAAGASVEVHLTGEGLTYGELVLPPDFAGDGDRTRSLDGTWSLDGDVVLLHHDPGTWLSAATFRYVDARLTSSYSVTQGGVTTEWRITLRKR